MNWKKLWQEFLDPSKLGAKVETAAINSAGLAAFSEYSLYDTPGDYKKREQRAEQAKFEAIGQFLAERKTVSLPDFERQLGRVVYAARAVENMQGRKDSPAAQLVNASLREEWAVLVALTFHPSMSAEAAEAFIEALTKEKPDVEG